MIELKNLRLEQGAEWTKLIADISSDNRQIPDNTMWFAIPNEYADMFTAETYDPFLLVSYYCAMVWNEDLKVHGKVSKLFYKNLTNYISQIFDEFSDFTHKITLTVEGFTKISSVGSLVGVSGSCGVDSLCTIYDHYVDENDPDYKVNAMFLFNSGTHGDFSDESRNLWLDRLKLNKRVAHELQLPIYAIDSNLHKFTHYVYHGDQPSGYLAIYCCIIACQKYVRKYFVSSEVTMQETLRLHNEWRDRDIAVANGHLLLSLIRTECLELVLDGAQYKRHEKVLHIADWEIAQKYLNTCLRPLPDGSNCTINCWKCRGAMLVLDVAGKVERFDGAFDTALYRSKKQQVKIQTVSRYLTDPLVSKDAVDYVKSQGMKMPFFVYAKIKTLPRRIKFSIKKRQAKKVR